MQNAPHERLAVSRERVVDCPFGVALEYAQSFLGTLRSDEQLWFGTRPDVAEPGKPHDEVAVWWRSGQQRFGDVEMVVRFRILRLSTRIELTATSDAAPASREAFQTALDGLLARLATYAEERECRYRMEHPPALGRVGQVATA